MNLNMRGLDQGHQEIPQGDPVIVTTHMGDCVSVIVLYNYDPNSNRYLHARGKHGLGGIQAIDFAALLAGVPNTPPNQIITIPGSLQQSAFAMQMNMEYVREGLHAHRNLLNRYVGNHPNARVDRQGNVTRL